MPTDTPPIPPPVPVGIRALARLLLNAADRDRRNRTPPSPSSPHADAGDEESVQTGKTLET